MDLSAILQKTKDRSQKITTKRKPVSIAIEERPYSFNETPSIEQIPFVTNKRQNGDKLETKRSENKDKLETNKRQIEDKSSAYHRFQRQIGDGIGDKNRDKLETKPSPKKEVVCFTLHDDSLTLFSMLVGIQRKLVLFFYEECKLNRSRVTQPLTMEYIVTSCGSTLSSIKKSIQRLESKGILKRATYKRGRSGWTRYELADQVYNDILYSENYRAPPLMHHENRDKLETQMRTQLETSASSSSSSNKTTTTTNELPVEWKEVDVSPLKLIHFGQIEIRNIFNKCPSHITASIVQESINQFAFGMTQVPERYKNMKSPRAVLVNSLVHGTPWVEPTYISLAEKQKREKEEKTKLMLEQKFKEPKFLEWFNRLPDDDREVLVPSLAKNSTSYLISKNIIQKEYALKHFEQTVWPEIIAELSMMFDGQ